MPQTFAFIAPVQPVFIEFCAVTKQIQNAPKQYEMHQYYSLGSNGVDRVRSLWKIPMRLNGTNLSINCTKFRVVTKHCQMHRNTTKMLQNMSLVPMGWIECVLCKKFRCDFMAQSCPLIAPVQSVLHRVSCSNETLTNALKHYKNAPKHEFRVQWGGSRVFVNKNSDASSWHKCLH